MLRKVILMLGAAAFLCSCSDETTDAPINTQGEIKGEVFLVNEFGDREFVRSGVSISLEGATGVHRDLSNTSGMYRLKNVPFGNYNLIAEKDGFVTSKIRGVSVAGGDEPWYQMITLVRPSTAKFNDISLSYSPGLITAKGTLVHNGVAAANWVTLVTFLSTSPDVTSEKYSQANSGSYAVSSGSSISLRIAIDPAKFPKGSTVYMKIYGAAFGVTPNFNYEKGRYEYPGLASTPSNVVSIVL